MARSILGQLENYLRKAAMNQGQDEIDSALAEPQSIKMSFRSTNECEVGAKILRALLEQISTGEDWKQPELQNLKRSSPTTLCFEVDDNAPLIQLASNISQLRELFDQQPNHVKLSNEPTKSFTLLLSSPEWFGCMTKVIAALATLHCPPNTSIHFRPDNKDGALPDMPSNKAMLFIEDKSYKKIVEAEKPFNLVFNGPC
jgi:hypothetical protein